MIRSVPTGASFSFGRRRLGDASAVLAFNPVTAGISAGVSLVSTGIGAWMNSIQTSHNADTATTLIVNGLQQQFINLNKAYFAERNPSCADQRAALNAYDQAWLWLQGPQACGNPNYGSAGNRCISDRAPGGRWDWAATYRDPIANDPRLAGQCDTGQAVILPTVATGYVDTGITAAGGSDATGQTAAQIAAAAVQSAAAPSGAYYGAPPAPPSTFTIPGTSTQIPTTYAYIGVAALLFLMVKK